MEVGLWNIYWEEREEVRMRQHVATLVHISPYIQSLERLQVVGKESCRRNCKTKLPCTLALDICKWSTSHRSPTVYGIEYVLSGTFAVVASLTKTYEQCASRVAFYIIIRTIGNWRKEKLAARVFPHITIVVRSYGTHTLLCNTIVNKQLLAVVCNANLHLWLIRILGSPAMAVHCNELNLSLVQQTTNLSRFYRGS